MGFWGLDSFLGSVQEDLVLDDDELARDILPAAGVVSLKFVAKLKLRCSGTREGIGTANRLHRSFPFGRLRVRMTP